jgi:phage tail-like protein
VATTVQRSDGRPTGLVTTSGRGFRSTARMRLFVGPGPRPSSAVMREYLRQGLPAMYQEQDFGVRFLAALEGVLDPIVAILDCLPAYLRADFAPHDLLELMTGWLGLELDETQPREHRRELIRRAPDVGRRRGTAAGLELALRLAFPGVPLRIEDGGGVVWAGDPAGLPEAGPQEFVVYCDHALAEERLAAIARFIERAKPVHVAYRLRVKKPKSPKATRAAKAVEPAATGADAAGAAPLDAAPEDPPTTDGQPADGGEEPS